MGFYSGTRWLGTSAAITLGAGRSATVSVKTTLPCGSRVITVIADPKNRVAESNETNNRRNTTVRT